MGIRRFALTCAVTLGLGGPVCATPLFPNSVVSNDIDFIHSNDPDAFHCIGYLGQSRAEMPDKRGGPLMQDNVHVFRAQYKDGTAVDLFVAPTLGSQSAARQHAMKAVHPIGKLPTFMRQTLSHVVIHKGDETAFAEDLGHFFVLYSENMDKRIRTHDLEETVFHETVHATLDAEYRRDRAWRRAQRADKWFVTEYARNNPDQEDMAESALFAYAHIITPGRLPEAVANRLEQDMPNRLAFFRELFPASNALFQKVGSVQGCN